MGRSAYKPTPDQRRTVAIAAGAGMSHEEIAAGLKISRPTLYKYFESELSEGVAQKRLEILKALHAAAKKGNVSAAKAYLAFTPTPSTPPLEGEQPQAAAEKTPKDAPRKPLSLGKKEQANADAVTAQKGTEWEELLGPTPPVQ